MRLDAKGPRLWLRAERRGRKAEWIIRDGANQRSTGCGAGDRAGAEKRLAAYIAEKHQPVRQLGRAPEGIAVAGVLAIYLEDKAPTVARPKDLGSRVERLLGFFGTKTLAEVNGKVCRAYAAARGEQAARRELEDLRAAIRHHWTEGYCDRETRVVLPEKAEPRGGFLTRSEIAAMLWHAWHYREQQGGPMQGRHTRRHIARFILVALYTGSRSGAILGAAIRPTVGHGGGYVDLDRGVFYRAPPRARQTKKRKPPVRLSERLLAHLRRWERTRACNRFVIEWNGAAVGSIKKAFAAVAGAAGVPHAHPHLLRHTAASWAKSTGMSREDAADLFGMTPEVYDRVYAQADPAWQREAIEKLSTRGGRS